ncbi:hypothetical protein GCM10010172_60830 [Paractinoplanes ferrugineus]|uniref:DUF998 domain-containing protein n=1 Tax=Paractinoplanes ferrugineus TaxID=113564 RepID=A0A919J8G8_9ACTN|nr:DUF998 domain-containing protein [Actinoplanes ferrugineus]GIE14589.1 hypothetical protein Afe05nite_64290 [Actinoplanes ferrugineus]
MIRNRLAVAAAVTVTGGAGVMLFTLVAGPGRWWQGYVSEAGTAGQPYAVSYRLGLGLLALGVALLGRARRHAALLLLVAAGLAGTSSVVPCSAGCPLPPFEPTTTADLVHTAASILGMAVLAAAMAVTWWTAARPAAPQATTAGAKAGAAAGAPPVGDAGVRKAVRRLAGVALVLTLPLAAAMALTMLFVGRGTVGALLERALLLVAVCWLVGTGLLSAPAAR